GGRTRPAGWAAADVPPRGPGAAPARGGTGTRRRRTTAPGVPGRVGRARRLGEVRGRRRRHGLRLRARGLPPLARPAAAQRLEGPRAGAVGARAEPRLPPLPGAARRDGCGDRGDRRGRPVCDVPARLEPCSRRRPARL
ncbi:MAG: FIG01121295: hypothetical protein, partial [uncultured Nocardioidaceae bacterium]